MARFFYDQFRIEQPHVETTGLYAVGYRCFIVCPELTDDLSAADGTPIVDWVNRERPIVTAIELVAEVPEGARRVPDRTLDEIVRGLDYPRPMPKLHLDLCLELPAGFPTFRLRYNQEDDIFDVFVTEPLTAAQEKDMAGAFDAVETVLSFRCVVGDPAPAPAGAKLIRVKSPDFVLTPSNYLRKQNIPELLLRLTEEDEQFWRDHRMQVLGSDSEHVEAATLIPEPWKEPAARCVVNAMGPAMGIHNYLTIYDQLILLPPPGPQANVTFQRLGVTEDELVELCGLGILKVLVPFSPERAPVSLLQRCAERDPSSLLMSRRLACISVCDIRRRFPLLFPPVGIAERSLMLRGLQQAVDGLPNDHAGDAIRAAVQDLKRIWISTERLVHEQGALGLQGSGIGGILAHLVGPKNGQSMLLEFTTASAEIDWTAPFGATVFPYQDDQFTTAPFVELIARAYSCLPAHGYRNFSARVAVALDGVLSVSARVPVLDLAKAMIGPDVARLRQVIMDLVENRFEPAEVQGVVDSFNEHVRKVGEREKWLNEHQIMGWVAAASSAAAAVEPTIGAVPFGIMIMDRVLAALEKRRDKSPLAGRVTDVMTAVMTQQPPKAALVSKLRRKLGELVSTGK